MIRRPLVAALVLLVLSAVHPPAARSHGDEAHPLLFVNGHWFDGQKFVRRDLYSVDGVLRDAHAGAVDDTVDLAGAYVIPPFADAHTHQFSDTSGFDRMLRRFLAAGILYVQNPNNPAAGVAAVRARLEQPRTVDARHANGGFTSPGGHPAQIYEPPGALAAGRAHAAGDAYVPVASEADLERAWPGVMAGRPDFLKIYLERSELHAERQGDAWIGRRGLDPRLVPGIVRRAHDAGLRVAAHVTSAADFRLAVETGVDEISHLPLEPLTDADARAAARRRVTVVTTTVSHRPAEGVADPDALHRDNLRKLGGAGVALALGTDHPTLTVLDEAANLRRIGAVAGARLLRLLTLDTRRAIFRDGGAARNAGPLVPGNEASFLVLDGDPLADFERLRAVRLRVKRGVRIEVPAEPAGKPSVAEAMMAPLMSGDLPGALALYDRLKRERPDSLDFGEQSLNALGYALLRHGQARGAVAIFEKNLAVFPNSANAWDSFADGLLAAGDSTRAITAYEQVIALAGRQPGPGRLRQLEQRAREQLAVLRRGR